MRRLGSQRFFPIDHPVIGYPFNNIVANDGHGLRPDCPAGAYQEAQ